jgi:hypothetical protein
MGVTKMFRVFHVCIIMYSPKEVTYNPNMLSIYLLKSMAFPQSSSSSSLSTAGNHYTKKHHHLIVLSKWLIHRIRRQAGRRKAPIRGICIIPPPKRERLIRQIKTEYHNGLHKLRTTIQANTKQVVILPKPNGVVTVNVSHTKIVQRQQLVCYRRSGRDLQESRDSRASVTCCAQAYI